MDVLFQVGVDQRQGESNPYDLQGGCMRGILLALERMGTNKRGAGKVVVNISSTVCLVFNPSGPTYSASKPDVVGLTRSLGDNGLFILACSCSLLLGSIAHPLHALVLVPVVHVICGVRHRTHLSCHSAPPHH